MISRSILSVTYYFCSYKDISLFIFFSTSTSHRPDYTKPEFCIKCMCLCFFVFSYSIFCFKFLVGTKMCLFFYYLKSSQLRFFIKNLCFEKESFFIQRFSVGVFENYEWCIIIHRNNHSCHERCY